MADDDAEVTGADGKDTGSNGRGAQSLMSSLMSKEVLIPAGLSAVGAVAAAKGPDLVRRLSEKTEAKGQEKAQTLGENAAKGAKNALTGGSSPGGVAGAAVKAVSKAVPGGGGGGRAKKTRRLPIQRWTDVAVPAEKAFDAWTNFEEFPKFMHRVLSVREEDDGKLRWQEKIWFSKREWEAEITDRRENDRIAWKTTSGTMHSGIVSFHSISDTLTRVMVTLNFEPTGMFEKMASGMRFAKRAVQADLARFKAYVEMEDAEGLGYDAGKSGQAEQQEDEQKEDEQNEENDDRSPEGSGDEEAGGSDGASTASEPSDERREREQRRQERRAAAAR